MNHSRMNAGNSRNYDFSRVPTVSVPRTRMYRPGSHKTSISTDYLYPLFVDEVLPGDTFRLDVATFARLTTAMVPFMDNLYIDWQFFFVPNRLVWDNWQKFCGEQANPGDSIDYTAPYLTSPVGGVSAKSLYDYFGIPINKQFAAHDVTSLPFRAYNLIWNEWYRDENLQNSVTVPTGDGPDSASTFTLLKRGKRKDYFTSALPAPQKGPSVEVPLLSGDLPVIGNGKAFTLTNGVNSGGLEFYQSGISGSLPNQECYIRYNNNARLEPVSSNVKPLNAPGVGVLGLTTNPQYACAVAKVGDLGQSVSINTLRQAFQMQKFFERQARGGTRYVEILKAMFGVTSPDARLQRPELLTSFTVPVQLYQNVQTSASVDGGTPQGNLGANGTASGVHFAFNRSFVEHGYIIGLASVRSDLTYQQGLHRMWSRSTRYDFYWPTFAHLGEQDIKNKEIFLQDASVVDSDGNVVNDKAFGYQERWSEYKYGNHRISGELRSQYSQSLDIWHLAQNFENLPTLSADFITESVPISRVLSISPDVSQPFEVDCAFDLVCVRPLPLYDVPGLVDHF